MIAPNKLKYDHSKRCINDDIIVNINNNKKIKLKSNYIEIFPIEILIITISYLNGFDIISLTNSKTNIIFS